LSIRFSRDRSLRELLGRHLSARGKCQDQRDQTSDRSQRLRHFPVCLVYSMGSL
jgi:hypothetical protein